MIPLSNYYDWQDINDSLLPAKFEVNRLSVAFINCDYHQKTTSRQNHSRISEKFLLRLYNNQYFSETKGPSCAPDNWTDQEGESCAAYKAKKFCEDNGKPGTNWKSFLGLKGLSEESTFADLSVDGYDASHCVECGCVEPETGESCLSLFESELNHFTNFKN